MLSSGASTIGAPEGALGPLQQVASTGMSGSTAPANMSSGSHAGAEDWDNFSEGSFEPLPSGPPGAAADPNAGPGVPESLI